MVTDVKAMLFPTTHSYNKSLTTNSNVEDVAMDELVKDFRELKIKLGRLEENDVSSDNSRNTHWVQNRGNLEEDYHRSVCGTIIMNIHGENMRNS